MIALLSPSKTLDTELPSPLQPYTMPDLIHEAADLISLLRDYTPEHIKNVMGISDNLATLNAQRFSQWALPFSPENAKQALLMFQGDVYAGLDSATLSVEDCSFAQQHLRILSGLYGLLKPLDLIQPYRLEMGLSLRTPKGKSLYAYWGDLVTETLNKHCAASESSPVIINLCSREYFKVIKVKQLVAPVIEIAFKERKANQYKTIGYFAKKARGLMCRYMIDQRIDQALGLKDFNLDGYRYNAELSCDQKWVFSR